MWVKISRATINAAGEIRILEFGSPNDEENINSYISVTDWDTYGYVLFRFVSIPYLLPVDDPAGKGDPATGGGGYMTIVNNALYDAPDPNDPSTGVWDTGPVGPQWFIPPYGLTGYSKGRPNYAGIPPGIPASFPQTGTSPTYVRYTIEGSFYGFKFDEWNHIVISIDGSVASVTTPPSDTPSTVHPTINSTAFMNMAWNGQDKTGASLDNLSDVDNGITYDVRGSVMPRMFYPASETTNGLGIQTGVQWRKFPKSDDPAEVTTVANGGDMVLDINGKQIGIPAQTTSAYSATQLVDMADVQIWVGKFIDPIANYNAFVNIVDGRGYPVPPATTAAMLGTQDYLFTGGPSTFYTNGGTGGDFVKSGTLNDIPGPSY